ncbi:MAG: hypothetical protein IT244_04630 [Bacteroidia bacterium]|nr:hypothetical protein [Bacteroidia bacterium]
MVKAEISFNKPSNAVTFFGLRPLLAPVVLFLEPGFLPLFLGAAGVAEPAAVAGLAELAFGLRGIIIFSLVTQF